MLLKLFSGYNPKIKRTSLFLVFALLAVPLLAQTPGSAFEKQVKSGFDQNKAAVISVYFAERVQLELEDQSGTYSQQQAASMLDDFFRNHVSEAFTVIKSGKAARSEANFLIGELKSKSILYRVYLLSSELAGEVVVHSLSITKI